MKNQFATIILTLATGVTVFFSACTDSTPSTDITYNAAYVVNGGNNSISVIDISTNEVKRTLELSGISFPHHIALSPDKSKVAIGIPGIDLSAGHGNMPDGMPGMFLVIDTKTGSILKTQSFALMNHNARFSPNGTEIWTAQMDSMGTVLVFDASTYIIKNTINVGMMPLEVTFSKDGLFAFVCNNMDSTVTVIDANTKAVITNISVDAGPIGAWPGADNKMYVDNEMSKTISVIDVPTKTKIASINLGFTPGMVTYNITDGTTWVTDADNGKVSVFQNSGAIYTNIVNITTAAGAHGINFTADYSIAYITNQTAGTVSVIDVASRTKIKDITVGTKPNGLIIKQ